MFLSHSPSSLANPPQTPQVALVPVLGNHDIGFHMAADVSDRDGMTAAKVQRWEAFFGTWRAGGGALALEDWGELRKGIAPGRPVLAPRSRAGKKTGSAGFTETLYRYTGKELTYATHTPPQGGVCATFGSRAWISSR